MIHYSTGNEIYRFAGLAFGSMVWGPTVALALPVVMIGMTVWLLHRKTIGVRKTGFRQFREKQN